MNSITSVKFASVQVYNQFIVLPPSLMLFFIVIFSHLISVFVWDLENQIGFVYVPTYLAWYYSSLIIFNLSSGHILRGVIQA